MDTILILVIEIVLYISDEKIHIYSTKYYLYTCMYICSKMCG